MGTIPTYLLPRRRAHKPNPVRLSVNAERRAPSFIERDPREQHAGTEEHSHPDKGLEDR